MYKTFYNLIITRFLGGKTHSMWQKRAMYLNRYTDVSSAQCDYGETTHMSIL